MTRMDDKVGEVRRVYEELWLLWRNEENEIGKISRKFGSLAARITFLEIEIEMLKEE